MAVDDGVATKIRSQVTRWREAGNQVRLFWIAKGVGDTRAGLEDSSGWRFAPLVGRPLATTRLARAVRRFAPDLVYVRYHIFVPPLHLVLPPRAAVVVEVNTDDVAEYRLHSRRLALYNQVTRRALLRRADGFVTVTRELKESSRFASFRKPTAVVANGAESDEIAHLDPVRKTRPRFVFVGTGGRWHGVDKIPALAQRMPEWDFDIVGVGSVDAPTAVNVVFHGFLDRDGYEPILARADVAIGTLALHRNQMDEGCPLKVREYLLSGLPTVIGYSDTDFLDDRPWFLLRIPNTERNVEDSVDGIREFAERMRGRRVPRELVEERLAARAKEVQRLEFFDEVVNGRRERRRA
jgi:glycosyltransferase involved in cell wall biosynthesis